MINKIIQEILGIIKWNLITDIIQEPLLTSRTLKQDEINCGLFLQQRPLAMLKIPDAEEKSFN